jgi:hypothetical protein
VAKFARRRKALQREMSQARVRANKFRWRNGPATTIPDLRDVELEKEAQKLKKKQAKTTKKPTKE